MTLSGHLLSQDWAGYPVGGGPEGEGRWPKREGNQGALRRRLKP